jgi:hypothetical protein
MNRFNVEQSLLTIAVQLSNIAFVAQALADQLKVAPAEEVNLAYRAAPQVWQAFDALTYALTALQEQATPLAEGQQGTPPP